MREPHGTINPTVHIQVQLSKPITPALPRHILCLVDDVLLHAKSFGELWNDMILIFSLFATLKVKLKPTKCILFSK